jgi:hypothetical protein
VVARARSAANSAFWRWAITTLGIPHVSELESRGLSPITGSRRLHRGLVQRAPATQLARLLQSRRMGNNPPQRRPSGGMINTSNLSAEPDQAHMSANSSPEGCPLSPVRGVPNSVRLKGCLLSNRSVVAFDRSQVGPDRKQAGSTIN